MSALNDYFALQLQAVGIEYDREVKVIEGRRFAFDFRIKGTQVLAELQGGTWLPNKTGHSTGTGIKRDCVKLNLAQLAGWKVLHFTSDMVRDGEALATVERMIEVKG